MRLMLCPDFGSRWGLWSSTPLHAPNVESGESLGPEHFDFDPRLSAVLAEWNVEWRDNFTFTGHPPGYYWTHGFDVASWIRKGDAIADLI